MLENNDGLSGPDDDNFHYQDESERVLHGVFSTLEEAITACRSIVDGYLTDAFKPGMTADALFENGWSEAIPINCSAGIDGYVLNPSYDPA